MISASLSYNRADLLRFPQAARAAPTRLPAAYRRDIQPTAVQILSRLQKEPGKPRYPLHWASELQRKFVMAKLRESGNLPYTRTGRLLDNYSVELTADESGGVLQIINKAPQAVFVVGAYAQPFHLDTGWVQMAPVADAFGAVALDVLLNTWFSLLDPTIEATS